MWEWGWGSICVVPTSSDTLAGKVVDTNIFPQYSGRQHMYIFTLLRCLAALICNDLPTFRHNLSVTSSRLVPVNWTDMLFRESVTTNQQRCITSQKSAELICTAVGDWNCAQTVS